MRIDAANPPATARITSIHLKADMAKGHSVGRGEDRFLFFIFILLFILILLFRELRGRQSKSRVPIKSKIQNSIETWDNDVRFFLDEEHR